MFTQSFNWNGSIDTKDVLTVFPMPYKSDGAINTINKIKLEIGENKNPIWTANPSDS